MSVRHSCLPVDDDVRRAGCAASMRRALVRVRAARYSDILGAADGSPEARGRSALTDWPLVAGVRRASTLNGTHQPSCVPRSRGSSSSVILETRGSAAELACDRRVVRSWVLVGTVRVGSCRRATRGAPGAFGLVTRRSWSCLGSEGCRPDGSSSPLCRVRVRSRESAGDEGSMRSCGLHRDRSVARGFGGCIVEGLATRSRGE